MSAGLTVRDRIEQIAIAMRTEQPPATIREFEVTLAALLWNVNLEVARAQIAFKKAIQDAPEKTSAARKQFAEAGPTYERLLEAEAVQQSLMEMLRTCRSHGRSLSDEMRLAR